MNGGDDSLVAFVALGGDELEPNDLASDTLRATAYEGALQRHPRNAAMPPE